MICTVYSIWQSLLECHVSYAKLTSKSNMTTYGQCYMKDTNRTLILSYDVQLERAFSWALINFTAFFHILKAISVKKTLIYTVTNTLYSPFLLHLLKTLNLLWILDQTTAQWCYWACSCCTSPCSTCWPACGAWKSVLIFPFGLHNLWKSWQVLTSCKSKLQKQDPLDFRPQ
jgi:hypothetical protein